MYGDEETPSLVLTRALINPQAAIERTVEKKEKSPTPPVCKSPKEQSPERQRTSQPARSISRSRSRSGSRAASRSGSFFRHRYRSRSRSRSISRSRSRSPSLSNDHYRGLSATHLKQCELRSTESPVTKLNNFLSDGSKKTSGERENTDDFDRKVLASEPREDPKIRKDPPTDSRVQHERVDSRDRELMKDNQRIARERHHEGRRITDLSGRRYNASRNTSRTEPRERHHYSPERHNSRYSRRDNEDQESEREAITLSKLDEMRTKHGYLIDLNFLESQGAVLTKRFSIDDEINEINFELMRQKNNIDCQTTVNQWILYIISATYLIEWLNTKIGSPLYFNGLGEYMQGNMQNVVVPLQKCYHRYIHRPSNNPIYDVAKTLLITMAGYHVQMMLVSPMTGSVSGSVGAKPASPSGLFSMLPMFFKAFGGGISNNDFTTRSNSNNTGTSNNSAANNNNRENNASANVYRSETKFDFKFPPPPGF